jgi:hypothetical protein
MIYLLNIILLLGLNDFTGDINDPSNTTVIITETEQIKPCPIADTEVSANKLQSSVESITAVDRNWRFRYKQNEYISDECPDGYLVVCNNSGQNCSSVIPGTCFDWLVQE